MPSSPAQLGFEIIGTGHYVPGPPVTNADLSRVMDTSDDWIFQRSGIRKRHFAPEGSDIAVSLRRVGHEAVFTMRDVGPGVSDFALPQLGQRFFSLPRPRDGRRGSGLGLAIVRQAAALHGGDPAYDGLPSYFEDRLGPALDGLLR